MCDTQMLMNVRLVVMSVTSLPAVTTPLEGTIVPVTWDSLGMGSLVAVSLVYAHVLSGSLYKATCMLFRG